MKNRKYYWTLAILAILFVFVVAADVTGLIGRFIGGGADTPAVTNDAVVTEATEEPALLAETAQTGAVDDVPEETEVPADAPEGGE